MAEMSYMFCIRTLKAPYLSEDDDLYDTEFDSELKMEIRGFSTHDFALR